MKAALWGSSLVGVLFVLWRAWVVVRRLGFISKLFLGEKMEAKIGPETTLKAEALGGKLKLSTEYSGVDLDAGAYVAATPDQLCNALAKLIPGDSAAEHAALAVVKGALDLAVKPAA